MNDAIDRELVAWLQDGPEQGPVHGLERALVATRRTRQRPSWTFPERWLPMDATFQRGVVPRPLVILAILGLLTAGAIATAILIGARRDVPDPFGPAANGSLIASVDGTLTRIDPETGIGQPMGAEAALRGSAPSFSLDGERFAYWSRAELDQAASLVVADVDGRPILAIETTALPGLAHTAAAPALSPDGSRVAVVLTADGRSTLFVIDAVTGTPTRIDAGPGSLGDPAWSPDGRSIAVRRSEAGQAAITVVGADGTGARDLVRRPDESARIFQGFTWSPSGDRIAYQYLELGGDVATVDLDGRVTTIAADPVSEFNPAFSPDGTTLAFLADDGAALDLAGVDGTDRRTLARDTFAGTGCRIWWSPDGEWILGSPHGSDCGPTDSGELVAVNVADPTVRRSFALDGRVTGLPSWQRVAP
jgi:hypothetical protein